ncbi:MAG TPA: cytochrome c [Nitrospira sp.]|jgi:mono/diheme cytochrome c family protein|nr:cytochrome c [Nitrospira sp.]
MPVITRFLTALLLGMTSTVWPADPAVLRPRVPPDQIDSARQVTNPYSPTPEIIGQGQMLFEGKAFCRTCHGIDGKGLGSDINPDNFRGALPRNFTDKDWQAARTDGELFWILKNGSKGTAMASFIPLVLTEEEAWKVITYVRSFGRP